MRNIGVGMGIMELPFRDGAGFWRWVDLCEAGGIDSLWQSDRIISREPVLETMTVMAALAGRTRKMKFGMNVLSVALRDPVLVAKQCATIDMLSGGRLLPAFGIGSPTGLEWAAMNIDTKTRGARTDEGLEIIRRLWAEDEVTFDGRFYKLDKATINPKPVQADLPLWIGGSSEAAIKRTARIGTGWQAAAETPAEIAPLVQAIRTQAAALGRSIDEDHFGIGIPFRFGRPDDPGVARVMDAYRKRVQRDPLDYFAIGDATTVMDRISAYVDAGLSKFVLRPVASGEDDVLAQTRLVVEQILPKAAARWPKVKKKAAVA